MSFFDVVEDHLAARQAKQDNQFYINGVKLAGLRIELASQTMDLAADILRNMVAVAQSIQIRTDKLSRILQKKYSSLPPSQRIRVDSLRAEFNQDKERTQRYLRLASELENKEVLDREWNKIRMRFAFLTNRENDAWHSIATLYNK